MAGGQGVLQVVAIGSPLRPGEFGANVRVDEVIFHLCKGAIERIIRHGGLGRSRGGEGAEGQGKQ